MVHIAINNKAVTAGPLEVRKKRRRYGWGCGKEITVAVNCLAAYNTVLHIDTQTKFHIAVG